MSNIFYQERDLTEQTSHGEILKSSRARDCTKSEILLLRRDTSCPKSEILPILSEQAARAAAMVGEDWSPNLSQEQVDRFQVGYSHRCQTKGACQLVFL